MPLPTRRALLAGAAALPLVPSLALGQTRHAVRIAGMAFTPAEIAIRAGDSVVFTNEDGAPHTATAEDGSWDTGRLDRGASVELTFAAPGLHRYRCAFHPSMRGRVIVS